MGREVRRGVRVTTRTLARTRSRRFRGKESDETSGFFSSRRRRGSRIRAPRGFVAFLFLVAATAGGVFHYRRANDGRFPTPPPGTGDAVRAVVAKGREAAARGNDIFRAKWHELEEGWRRERAAIRQVRTRRRSSAKRRRAPAVDCQEIEKLLRRDGPTYPRVCVLSRDIASPDSASLRVRLLRELFP